MKNKHQRDETNQNITTDTTKKSERHVNKKWRTRQKRAEKLFQIKNDQTSVQTNDRYDIRHNKQMQTWWTNKKKANMKASTNAIKQNKQTGKYTRHANVNARQTFRKSHRNLTFGNKMQQINHNKHVTQTTRKTNVNVVSNKQITNPTNKRRRDETNNKKYYHNKTMPAQWCK